MPEFLELIPPASALEKLLRHLPYRQPRMEVIMTEKALGRVTALPVVSPEPLPAFSRSTVDGYALRAADTYGASEGFPGYCKLVGEVPMGGVPNFRLSAGECALIHTGGMLPEGADCVLMVENSQQVNVEEIEILKAVARGENVLAVGEDVKTGEEVIPAGKILGPADLGGLMALGITQVFVSNPPRVGIISSGDEVIPPDGKPVGGQVRNINTYSLGALIEKYGGVSVSYGILPDQENLLLAAVKNALAECDMVVITAGSSASVRDLTSKVIDQAGKPGVLVHGMNVKPGKPTILAVCDGKPVIGLPGNPVSALVIAWLTVAPVLDRLNGVNYRIAPKIQARLTTNLASQAGREDWVPVLVHQNEDGFNAEPIFFKSNLIFMLAKADGLVKIEADANGIEAGTIVDIHLF